MSITLVAVHSPFLRCQSQIELDRSLSETTTPANPHSLLGSCDGRSSSTICCSAPRSMLCLSFRLLRSQKCRLWPYLPPSSNSGLRPFSSILGVPHSLVIITSRLRCHQKS